MALLALKTSSMNATLAWGKYPSVCRQRQASLHGNEIVRHGGRLLGAKQAAGSRGLGRTTHTHFGLNCLVSRQHAYTERG